MIDWEMVAAVSAAITVLGTAFLWIIHAILAPLKVVVEDNTRAVREVVNKIDEHREKIADLDKRVAVIETVHTMEAT